MPSIPLAPGVGIRWMFNDTETPMASRALAWAGFIRLVRTVAEAGIAPPPQYEALLARYEKLAAAVTDGGTLQRRLTEAVLGGADADLAALFAAALAERHAAGSELRAGLLGEVREHVLDALRKAYAPGAARAYAQLADQFDRAATDFTRAANIIDPGAPADAVVSANQKTLGAWHGALTAAGQLDALLEPLCAAAELVRGLDQPSGLGLDRTPFLLALCADTDGLHRRVVWHAWHDLPEPRPVDGTLKVEDLEPRDDSPLNTRGGKWTRLLAVSAEIRAHPRPSEMPLFGAPEPLGWKPTMTPGMRRPELRRFDPHGPLPADPPKRRLRDLFKRTPNEPEPPVDIMSTVLLDDNEGD